MNTPYLFRVVLRVSTEKSLKENIKALAGRLEEQFDEIEEEWITTSLIYNEEDPDYPFDNRCSVRDGSVKFTVMENGNTYFAVHDEDSYRSFENRIVTMLAQFVREVVELCPASTVDVRFLALSEDDGYTQVYAFKKAKKNDKVNVGYADMSFFRWTNHSTEYRGLKFDGQVFIYKDIWDMENTLSDTYTTWNSDGFDNDCGDDDYV